MDILGSLKQGECDKNCWKFRGFREVIAFIVCWEANAWFVWEEGYWLIEEEVIIDCCFIEKL